MKFGLDIWKVVKMKKLDQKWQNCPRNFQPVISNQKLSSDNFMLSFFFLVQDKLRKKKDLKLNFEFRSSNFWKIHFSRIYTIGNDAQVATPHIFSPLLILKNPSSPQEAPHEFLTCLVFKLFWANQIMRFLTNQREGINLKTSLCKMECCTFCMFRNQQREQHDLHQLDHFYNLRTNKHLLYKIGNLQQPTQIVITWYESY